MLRRTRRTVVATLLALAVISAPAIAGDDDGKRVTKDESNPGLEILIKKPGKQADGGSDRPVSDGSRSSFGENLGNVCTGNIGASSSVSGGSLADRLDACQNTPEPEGVNAAALARTVLDRLDLATPQMHTSPESPVKALVGLETWMWVAPEQWDVLTESASLGGTTVTVRAEPTGTRWDMGEGSKACAGSGRVWRKGLGQNATTSCGYTYRHTSLREPGDKYQISASITYSATWTCQGDCSTSSGSLGSISSATSTTSLEVSERQSVVINR